jgi:hypothetical protein
MGVGSSHRDCSHEGQCGAAMEGRRSQLATRRGSCRVASRLPTCHRDCVGGVGGWGGGLRTAVFSVQHASLGVGSLLLVTTALLQQLRGRPIPDFVALGSPPKGRQPPRRPNPGCQPTASRQPPRSSGCLSPREARAGAGHWQHCSTSKSRPLAAGAGHWQQGGASEQVASSRSALVDRLRA